MGLYVEWYAPLATPSELLLLEEAPPKPSQGDGVSPNCLKHNKKELSPLGESWRGALVGLRRGFELSYTLLYIYAREAAVVTVMTALTFVGTNSGGC